MVSREQKKRRLIKKPSINEGSVVTATSSAYTKDIDYPIFCFKHIHKDHDLSSCDGEEKSALITQLTKLSQLTWNDIKLAPRHGMGSEKISRKSIKPSIPSFVSEDVDSFLSFRFQGMKPFIGHRSGMVLHILYIDNKFSVYKH